MFIPIGVLELHIDVLREVRRDISPITTLRLDELKGDGFGLIEPTCKYLHLDKKNENYKTMLADGKPKPLK